MLDTVQDAVDFVASPETFRADHQWQSRYSYAGDPYPTDVRYSKEHEWIRMEGNKASIGITYFAQQSVDYVGKVQLPEVGDKIAAGEIYATAEVAMSGSAGLVAPVSGTVTEVNRELTKAGKIINQDPYAAWIIKVELTNLNELKSLLSAADYEKFVTAIDTSPTHGLRLEGMRSSCMPGPARVQSAESAALQKLVSDTIGDKIFFYEDSADMSPFSRDQVQKWADWMKANPNVIVTIEGHTDNHGTEEYDLLLGERMAASVLSRLVELGIDPKRISTISYGKKWPAVVGENEAARAQNRRVVMVVN
jgi:glycine cleavage system H protein